MKISTRRTSSENPPNPLITLVKCLAASFVFTGLLLLLMAFLLLKLGLTEKAVSVAIIVIYVASSFLAGFLAGKVIKVRRFLWGMLAGICYFLILLILSLIISGTAAVLADSVFTTFILCAAGGTLGGMLS